jgi:hypothetical protein
MLARERPMSAEDDYDDYETARSQEDLDSGTGRRDSSPLRFLVLTFGAIIAAAGLFWLLR